MLAAIIIASAFVAGVLVHAALVESTCSYAPLHELAHRWRAERTPPCSKRHIATLEQALTRRNRRIRELDAQRDKSDLTHRAPVIAADRKPLREGETVYLPDGTLLHVTGIGDMTEGHQTVFGKAGNDIIDDEWDAVLLTHQRPVLDADGVPIDDGDTVRNATTSAVPFTVREIERSDDPDEPEDIVWCGEHAANGFKVWRIADQLTHTKPEIDSWQSIEEDVDALVDAEDNGAGSFNAANDYCERHGLENGTVWVMMARDLVRRCREVAERERGE